MVLKNQESGRVTQLEEEIADLRKALEDFVVKPANNGRPTAAEWQEPNTSKHVTRRCCA